MEALGDGVGAADFLVDLHAGARADDRHVFVEIIDEAPRCLLGGFGNDEHAVAVADLDRYGGANFLGQARGKAGKIVARRRGA